MPAYARWGPAGLLLAVAVMQFLLARVGPGTPLLSPWKGGGFGMFTVVDAPGHRAVSGEGLTETGDRVPIVLRLPSGGAEAIRDQRALARVRSLPNSGALEDLGQRLLSSGWAPETPAGILREVGIPEQLPLVSGQAKARYLRPAADGPEELSEITLQTWRLQFDPFVAVVSTVPLGKPVTVVGR
jgi:hypothetical protein